MLRLTNIFERQQPHKLIIILFFYDGSSGVARCGALKYVPSFFLPFVLIWGDTRSLRMPALRPASQAGPMRNPREGTSVVLRDIIRLT